MENDAIDFVLLWVDGEDPAWQELFLKYKGEEGDQRPIRFRDMGTLRYWFRGVEQFAPWVNKIYFVTCGQTPEWLNTKHPKLVCVRHDEYIPAEYLPTFSSNTIEMNLHRIADLSAHFVLFNDDTFLVRSTRPDDFFRHGLPCDEAVMEYHIPTDYPLFLMPFVNACILNRHFYKRDVMLRHFGKFFSLKYGLGKNLKNLKHFSGRYIPGFHAFHLPSSLLKSVFGEIWEAEPELLDTVCRHRFRALTDVNQWLIQGWQRCTGRISPQRYPGTSFFIRTPEDARFTAQAIISSKYKMLCLNDEVPEDFDAVKAEIVRAFEELLPQKSSFER